MKKQTVGILGTFVGLSFALWLMLMGCQPAEADDGPQVRDSLQAGGGVYYVATDGDDDNVGSEAQPWRTVQHAADMVAAGDTVTIRGGFYNEAVFINVSGSAAGGTITFESYEGETAVLDGTGLSNPDGDIGIEIIGQSYLIIKGLEIRSYTTTAQNAVPMGIFVTEDAHHIQLINNHIHHIENNGGQNGNAHGIAVYGTEAPASIHNLLIQGNDLHDMKLGNSEALVLNGNVELFTVTQNRVYDNDNIGIDLIGFEDTAPDSAYDQARDGVVSENVVYNIDTIANPAYGGEQSAAGIYVDGGTRIVIERNHVYQSNMGIEIASEHQGHATSYVTVRNNLIHQNHIAGLAMGGYDTNRGSTENCTVINNTFFQNDSNQDGNGELYIQFDTRNNVIKNNIFVANAQSWLMTNAYTQNQNNVVDYNLYFAPAGADDSEWQWKDVMYQGFEAYRLATGNDTHSLFADPDFVNASPLDLHLQAGSLAIDVGDNLPEVGEVDFDGIARIQNNTIDLGALEFVVLDVFIYTPLVMAQ